MNKKRQRKRKARGNTQHEFQALRTTRIATIITPSKRPTHAYWKQADLPPLSSPFLHAPSIFKKTNTL